MAYFTGTVKKLLPIACILAALLSPALFPSVSKASENSGVEGRVVHGGKGLEGAKIFAYLSFADFVGRKVFRVSGETSAEGRYRMDLPPGVYYLAAQKSKGESLSAGDYFSFHGSNPVAVKEGKHTRVGFSIGEVAAPTSYAGYENPAEGAISGVVTHGGIPLEGAYVTLYADPVLDLRGMAYANSPATGKNGVFRFDSLPELDYFVIARKRASGKAAGPVEEGDFFGFYHQGPVKVRAGKEAKIELPVAPKSGEPGQEEGLFRRTSTRIEGKILDREGKPARGVYAFAYLDKVMGHVRPESISDRPDREGRYVLNLEEGGVYYVGARSNYGDTPAIGEWYGRWDGTGDHSVKIETGQVLENIDIIVEKILP